MKSSSSNKSLRPHGHPPPVGGAGLGVPHGETTEKDNSRAQSMLSRFSDSGHKSVLSEGDNGHWSNHA
eukprot:scaffold101313_cov45-Prasinocladus_malaysianus.AAC.1